MLEAASAPVTRTRQSSPVAEPKLDKRVCSRQARPRASVGFLYSCGESAASAPVKRPRTDPMQQKNVFSINAL